MEKPKTIKINLGCGFVYLDGYINCDVMGKADKYFDLNKFPYPFKDNSIDEVLLSHVLEHLDKPIEVLAEIYRICKKDALVIIKTPYFSSQSAFADIDHKHFFTWTTLDAVNRENPVHNRNPFYNRVDFKIVNKKLLWRPQLKPLEWLFNLFPRIYQELFCWIFPAYHINYILKKK